MIVSALYDINFLSTEDIVVVKAKQYDTMIS